MRDSLSRLLRYQSDYRFLLQNMAEVYEGGHQLLRRGDLLQGGPVTDRYPRYPFPFKMLTTLSPFDLRKIFGCVVKPEDLLQVMDEQLVSMAHKYRKYPPNRFGELLDDVRFQYTFFDSPKIFDLSLYNAVLSYQRGQVYWGYVLDDLDLEPPLAGSALAALYRYLVFRNVVQRTTDAIPRLQQSVENRYQDVSGQFLVDAFVEFVTQNSETLSLEIVQLYLSLVYRFPHPAEELCQEAAQELRPRLVQLLGGALPAYLSDDPAVGMGHSAARALCNLLCIDWTRRFAILPGKDQQFIEALLAALAYWEEASFQQFVWDERRLRDYMFVPYLYCQFPYKFLTLLPLTIHHFVVQEAKPANVDGFDRYLLRQHLGNLAGAVDWEAVAESLHQLLTADYLTAMVGADVGLFASAGFLIQVMDRLVTDLYERGRLTELVEALFLILRRLGLVSSYHHWDQEYVLYLYLKGAFRAALLNNRLFFEFRQDFQTCLVEAMSAQEPQVLVTPEILAQSSTAVIQQQFQLLADLAEDLFTTALTKRLIFDHLSYYLIDRLQILSPAPQTVLPRGSEVMVVWDMTASGSIKVSVSLRRGNTVRSLGETDSATDRLKVVIPSDLEPGVWFLSVVGAEGVARLESRVEVLVN